MFKFYCERATNSALTYCLLVMISSVTSTSNKDRKKNDNDPFEENQSHKSRVCSKSLNTHLYWKSGGRGKTHIKSCLEFTTRHVADVEGYWRKALWSDETKTKRFGHDTRCSTHSLILHFRLND